LETNQELFLGQHIKVKSTDPRLQWANDKRATVIGVYNGQTQVRPDAAPKEILLLYPHEIRDTDPPQEAPPLIRATIPELAQAAS